MANQPNNSADEIVAKIKELVRQGNIARVMVKRKEETVVNIPVNAGLVGAAIGLAAGPWAILTAAVAALGLDCKVVLVKTDGTTVELLSRDLGRKAAGTGAAILDKIASKGEDQE